MQYKVGQIITSTREVELETALSGNKVKVPTGNKVIPGILFEKQISVERAFRVLWHRGE